MKAADAARLSMWLLEILKDIFPWDRHGVTRSFEMWGSLARKNNKKYQEIGLCAKSIVVSIISNLQGSDPVGLRSVWTN